VQTWLLGKGGFWLASRYSPKDQLRMHSISRLWVSTVLQGGFVPLLKGHRKTNFATWLTGTLKGTLLNSSWLKTGLGLSRQAAPVQWVLILPALEPPWQARATPRGLLPSRLHLWSCNPVATWDFMVLSRSLLLPCTSLGSAYNSAVETGPSQPYLLIVWSD
jgi:hypothetical protein